MVTCSPGQPTSTRQCPPHLAFHGVELPMAAAVRAGMDEPALLKASRPSQVILQHAILANGPAEHCLRAAAEPSKILLEPPTMTLCARKAPQITPLRRKLINCRFKKHS